jgi:hypothetical protein
MNEIFLEGHIVHIHFANKLNLHNYLRNQLHMNECPCILCTFGLVLEFEMSSISINKQKFAAKAHSSIIIGLLNIQYEDSPCICTFDSYG